MGKRDVIKGLFSSKKRNEENSQTGGAPAVTDKSESSQAGSSNAAGSSVDRPAPAAQAGSTAEKPELWSTSGEYGIKVFADPSEPHVVDIVFVHGLTGNRETTWRAKGKNPWPQELLPEKVPGARIISFGYDAYVAGLQRPSQNTFADHARNLINQLEDFRLDTDTLEKPILFVTHSLGGLVTERALLVSRNGRENDRGSILKHTEGIIFMGTPLKGSSLAAWATRTGTVISHLSNANIDLMEILKIKSSELQSMQQDFSAMCATLQTSGHDIEIRCYFEELEMAIPGIGKVVEQSSATFSNLHPAVGIRADHSAMTKFFDSRDSGFISVASTLKRWIAILPATRSLSTLPSEIIGPGRSTQEQSSVAAPTVIDEATERRCLLSLSFAQMDNREHNIDRAHRGTCDWLPETKEYQDWMQGADLARHNGVLWIRGKPGAGKSTLLKQTYTFCKKQNPDRIIITYFFNARGQPLEKSPLGMYRSLVFQLVDKIPDSLIRLVSIFYTKEKKHGQFTIKDLRTTPGSQWEWTAAELKDFLLSEIEHLSLSVLVFVDALDECRDAQDRSDPEEVVHFLEDWSILASECQVDFKICLSSRHYPHIYMTRFIDCNLDEREEHLRDIRIFVRDKLHYNDEDIQQELRSKSKGVFMWVVLVTAMLNEAYGHGNIDALHDKLETIPKDLDTLFWDILGNDKEVIQDTVLLFQLLLFPTTSSGYYLDTPLQIFCAMRTGIDPDYSNSKHNVAMDQQNLQRYVRNRSKGLIEIRRGKKKSDLPVQFIHESVRDFLLRNERLRDLDPSLGRNFVGTSYERLSDLCLSYLVAHCRGHLNCKCSSKWATSQIFIYAGLAQQHGIDQQGRLRRIMEHYPSVLQQLRQSFNYDETSEYSFDPLQEQQDRTAALLLYLLCLNSWSETGVLCKIVLAEIRDLQYLNAISGCYGTALGAAALSGNLEAVQMLLDTGADVNFQWGMYGTALVLAFAGEGWYHEKVDVVKTLLKAGAVLAHGEENSDEALQMIAHWPDLECVKLLLLAGADVHFQGGQYGNALSAAIQSPSTEVIVTKSPPTEVAVIESPWIVVEIVEALLDAGTEVDEASYKHLAALDIPDYVGAGADDVEYKEWKLFRDLKMTFLDKYLAEKRGLRFSSEISKLDPQGRGHPREEILQEGII